MSTCDQVSPVTCIAWTPPSLYALPFFFLNDPPPTKTYPLPLHDALPISPGRRWRPPSRSRGTAPPCGAPPRGSRRRRRAPPPPRAPDGASLGTSRPPHLDGHPLQTDQIGRASCRERV